MATVLGTGTFSNSSETNISTSSSSPPSSRPLISRFDCLCASSLDSFFSCLSTVGVAAGTDVTGTPGDDDDDDDDEEEEEEEERLERFDEKFDIADFFRAGLVLCANLRTVICAHPRQTENFFV